MFLCYDIAVTSIFSWKNFVYWDIQTGYDILQEEKHWFMTLRISLFICATINRRKCLKTAQKIYITRRGRCWTCIPSWHLIEIIICKDCSKCTFTDRKASRKGNVRKIVLLSRNCNWNLKWKTNKTSLPWFKQTNSVDARANEEDMMSCQIKHHRVNIVEDFFRNERLDFVVVGIWLVGGILYNRREIKFS